MTFQPRSQLAEHRPWLAVLAALAVLLGLAGVSGVVGALYTGAVSNSGNEFVAAPDWVAPTASSSVIGKTQGGVPGYVRQGGTYNVFANVGDSGAPASGVASVAGNLGTITTGQSGAALLSGSFAIGAASYNYRSGSLTANATLAAGTYTYSLTSKDDAANSLVQSGYTVIVDNTAPIASDIQTTNKSGNVSGLPEIGDTAIFTFSEPIDPNSVNPGWTGASTNVVVRIENNTPTNDRLAIYNATNATLLALGTVNLGRKDYVSANATFGAGGVASTMTQSGNAITVTLGTASSGPTAASSTAAMIWTPSASATDRAGNAASTAPRTETGTTDRDF